MFLVLGNFTLSISLGPLNFVLLETNVPLVEFMYLVYSILDVPLLEFMYLVYSVLDVPLLEFMYLVYSILDVPLVEFMYLVFAHTPGESYRRRLRSLLFACVTSFER